MIKYNVYIETSIISYLTARPSRDLIIAGQQQITRTWWDFERNYYNLFISESVLNEIRAGDNVAAELRLNAVKNIPLLDLDGRVLSLTHNIINSGIIPQKAVEDAIHISIATVHEMAFLLTWNCKHIANAHITKKLINIIKEAGYDMPTICTPLELIKE